MSKDSYNNARELFEKGDFNGARKILQQIKNSKAAPDIKEKTQDMLGKLKTDKVEIIIGSASLLLLTFLYVFFGILR